MCKQLTGTDIPCFFNWHNKYNLWLHSSWRQGHRYAKHNQIIYHHPSVMSSSVGSSLFRHWINSHNHKHICKAPRLDYANSILFKTSTSNINKLQRVQNTLARIALPNLWSTPVLSLLNRLHWLPVTYLPLASSINWQLLPTNHCQ